MDLLKGTVFEDAIFRGLQHGTTKIAFKEFVDVKFVKCSFQDSAFVDCKFINCTFNNCNLTMLGVDRSQFSNVVFEECQAVGINWTKASWDKKGFFRSIHFHGCTLNYSSFFGLKLPKMKMTDCVAHEVDFGQADVTDGIFTGTDFGGSIFMQTTLTSANFVGASNYHIAPLHNVLKKAKFSLPEALSLLHGLEITLVDSD